MESPWKRAKKTQAQQQEQRLAQREGGQRQPNSGALWNRPRDVRLDLRISSFLVECRTTSKKSYAVQEDEWNDLTRQALRDSRLPGFQIEFPSCEIWLMRQGDFDQFCAAFDQLLRENKRLREELHGKAQTENSVRESEAG